MATKQKQPDQLIDILMQLQERKTVKPEDATKALTQYRKVLDQIKELKKEIELFKTNRGKPSTDQEETKKINSQTNITSRRTSKVGLQQMNGSLSQSTSSVQSNNKPNSRISTLDKQQQNGNIKSPRRPPSEPVNKTENTSDNILSPRAAQKTQQRRASLQPNSRSSSMAPSSVKDNKNNTANGKSESAIMQAKLAQQTKDISEKDHEIARLRFQNAQLKVTLDNKGGDANSTAVPNEDNKNDNSSLERKNFPLPQKLVVEFKVIYEQEWKFAYQDLERHYKMQPEAITDLLSAVSKEAYIFCQNFAKQQLEDLNKAHAYVIDVLVQPKYVNSSSQDKKTPKSKAIIDKEGYQMTRRHLKQYRRLMAHVPVSGLIEIFDGVVQKDVLLRHSNLRITPKSFQPLVRRLIEVNWMMSLTEPQIVQLWLRCGQLMSREMFMPYGKKGATVIHTVWPAVLLQKDGEVAEKGLCLVK